MFAFLWCWRVMLLFNFPTREVHITVRLSGNTEKIDIYMYGVTRYFKKSWPYETSLKPCQISQTHVFYLLIFLTIYSKLVCCHYKYCDIKSWVLFNKILNNQFYLLNKAKILPLVSVYRINSMCNPSMKMSLLFDSKAEFS